VCFNVLKIISEGGMDSDDSRSYSSSVSSSCESADEEETFERLQNTDW